MGTTLAACLLAISACAAMGEPQNLLANRLAALKRLNQRFDVAGEHGESPKPNLQLKQDWHERNYADKAAAVFGLVDLGELPEAKLEDANRLLRYQMLGKWRITKPGQLAGDSGIWMHRARSLGIRTYIVYKDLLDEDIRAEFNKRLDWLAREPFIRKSENIKLTNISSYFLAHEILDRTNAATYRQNRAFLIDYLRDHLEAGTHEWGSHYNWWTYAAILNLAEFAEDDRVRQLAMAVADYDLARALAMSVDGYFCSPAVRRYPFWTVDGYIEPQTQQMRLYFGAPGEIEHIWADFLISNYAPLPAHRRMFERKPPYEAAFTDDSLSRVERRWRSRIERGPGYGLASHLSLGKNHYALPSGGTHDIIGCYVQSAKGPQNHVVPYGYTPFSPPRKKRNQTERYFSRGKVAFFQSGGVTRAVWAGGRFEEVRIRLYAWRDFKCVIDGPWAFVSDGVTHAAWAPTIGRPERDPQSAEFSDPGRYGYWLRSTHAPGPGGETAVLEVAGAAETDFDAFRREAPERNPDPRWKDGQVAYTAPDGARIIFSNEGVTVDGTPFDLHSVPRAQGPLIEGDTLGRGAAMVSIDFDSGELSGATRRLQTGTDFDGAPGR